MRLNSMAWEGHVETQRPHPRQRSEFILAKGF